MYGSNDFDLKVFKLKYIRNQWLIFSLSNFQLGEPDGPDQPQSAMNWLGFAQIGPKYS